MYPYSACTITWVAAAWTPARSKRSRTRTPVQEVSNFDHFVTQWMSRVSVTDGSARSDDLVIDGPAAEIRIGGAADLRARTFDQTIVVLPKTANLLTAVGAITAGPVGAAVGAMANAVLRRPLGDLGAKVYRVTGPWDSPKVEVVARPRTGAPVAQPPPPESPVP